MNWRNMLGCGMVGVGSFEYYEKKPEDNFWKEMKIEMIASSLFLSISRTAFSPSLSLILSDQTN